MSGVRKYHEHRAWSIKTGKAITHGLPASYKVHGCGCEPCWAAQQSSRGVQGHREIVRAASERRIRMKAAAA